MASEKRFVREGLDKAQINEYFAKQLDRVGYGGMKIGRTPMGTQVTIFAEKPGLVIGRGGKTVRKLTRDLSTFFKVDNPQIDVKEVEKPELNAQMMATRLASVIERGWYFRKAGHSLLRRIMDAGALGCEIIISGKLTGPRARSEKFVDGYIKHAGKPAEELVREGYAIAVKKLGVIGCKVRIIAPDVILPDKFQLSEIKEISTSETEKKRGIEELLEEEGEKKEKEEIYAEKVLPEKKKLDRGEDWEETRLRGSIWEHRHHGHEYWHAMSKIHDR